MAEGVFVPGVFVTGVFVESTVVITGPVDIDISVGPPGAVLHRTALATPRSFDLLYWEADSPWAPYDAEPIFSIWNHMGIYVFGKKIPPVEIQAMVWHHDATLLDASPVTFSATPMGSNLLGSVSAGQRPTASVTLRNDGKWWNERINYEAFLGMGAGLFLIIKGQFTVPVMTGTIGRLTLVDDTIVIEYGEFKRDIPPNEKIWFIN